MIEWARARCETRPPDLFFVDIRDIPVTFASRPAGQEGGSVYGFDQPEVLKAIVEKGCLDVFEFRHGGCSDQLKLLRQVTVPEEDPFIEFAEGISTTIHDATRADLTVTSHDGVLVDADATTRLSALKLDAGLAIDKARLYGRVPLGDEYKGYLFIDIESSGHHGYTALLAVVNEKTDGILGYVSLEPLQHPIDELPGVFYIIATWFNRTRIVVDIAAGSAELPKFLDRAISIAKQAIGKDPNAATRSALDQIIEHYGGTFEAAKSLMKYFKMGDLNSGVNLGMLLVGMGKFDEGVEVLKETFALGSADAAFNLGTVHAQRKSYQDAETWFLKALEMGDKEAHYSLGRIMESQGDWERAEYYYRLAHEVDGDYRAPNNLGIALYKLGRYEEARRYLKIGAQGGDELAAFNLEKLDW
jgi:tetratricopeptide (TPR) repeat protein